MPGNGPYNDYDNGNEEDEYGDPVHPVHQENVYIFRIVGIAFAQVKVGENLLPHGLYAFSLKLLKKFGGFFREPSIFAVLYGELAHLVERLHGMQEVTGSIPVFSTDRIKGFKVRL